MAKEVNNLRNIAKEPQQGNAAVPASREQLIAALQRADAEIKSLRATAAQMEKQLMSYQMQDYYTRLQWLWKIVMEGNAFPKDFRDAKMEEFIEMMTPVTESEASKEEKEK